MAGAGAAVRHYPVTPMASSPSSGAPHRTDMQWAELQALDALRASAAWRPRISEPGIRISTGMLPHVPLRGYRSDVEFHAPPQDLVMLIADQMVERLGEWNEEFVEGKRLTTLSEQPGCIDWLFHVGTTREPGVPVHGPKTDRERDRDLHHVSVGARLHSAGAEGLRARAATEHSSSGGDDTRWLPGRACTGHGHRRAFSALGAEPSADELAAAGQSSRRAPPT